MFLISVVLLFDENKSEKCMPGFWACFCPTAAGYVTISAGICSFAGLAVWELS